MGCAFPPLKCRWHGCCSRNFSQTTGESTCISTGIYGYPIEDAAKIAVREVGDYLTQSCREAEVAEEESGMARSPSALGEDGRARTLAAPQMGVIFCCFSERDNQIYEQVLENLK